VCTLGFRLVSPNVIRREGLLPALEVAKEYLKLAVRYDNHEPNTKFCLVQLLSDQLETPLGRCLLSANDNKEMCELWKLEGYLKECQDLKADAVSKLSQDVKEVCMLPWQLIVYRLLGLLS
jgi:tRNA-dihydrouridine synthase 2